MTLVTTPKPQNSNNSKILSHVAPFLIVVAVAPIAVVVDTTETTAPLPPTTVDLLGHITKGNNTIMEIGPADNTKPLAQVPLVLGINIHVHIGLLQLGLVLLVHFPPILGLVRGHPLHHLLLGFLAHVQHTICTAALVLLRVMFLRILIKQ